MKVALIPPVPMLPEFGNGSFHLLLTHLLERKAYLNHYVTLRNKGAYLLLDNSAHEKGHGEDAASLMARALQLQAQEVVVPDVLFDGPGTIEACTKAHEIWYEAGHPGMVRLNPALMYVAQGKDIEEWAECLKELVQIHIYCALKHDIRRDLVLGISKDYEIWDGGIMRLIGDHVKPLIDRLATLGIHAPVHLLGWGRRLWELQRINKAYPWIRSTDSAKPFVYALHGTQLDRDLDPPEYPGRPKNYFSIKMTEEEKNVAHWNVAIFKGLV